MAARRGPDGRPRERTAVRKMGSREPAQVLMRARPPAPSPRPALPFHTSRSSWTCVHFHSSKFQFPALAGNAEPFISPRNIFQAHLQVMCLRRKSSGIYKKLLELITHDTSRNSNNTDSPISEHVKVAGYKINTQTLIVFLCTRNQ